MGVGTVVAVAGGGVGVGTVVAVAGGVVGVGTEVAVVGGGVCVGTVVTVAGGVVGAGALVAVAGGVVWAGALVAVAGGVVGAGAPVAVAGGVVGAGALVAVAGGEVGAGALVAVAGGVVGAGALVAVTGGVVGAGALVTVAGGVVGAGALVAVAGGMVGTTWTTAGGDVGSGAGASDSGVPQESITATPTVSTTAEMRLNMVPHSVCSSQFTDIRCDLSVIGFHVSYNLRKRGIRRREVMRLEGKVALISGGARGMGVTEARLFASEGAKVVLGDILEEQGQAVQAEIVESGGEAVFVKLDVTIESDWREAVGTALQHFGKLDVLVNNAGIFDRSTVQTQTIESWDRVMSINAKGVFLGTKAVIPAMRDTGGGSIVNISSVAGLTGSIQATSYNTSKGAVRILTKSIAIQCAADGIRCNSIHPGPIETMMLDEVFPSPEVRAQREAVIPMGRFGTMEDVARGVLFLASDEASYMTGSELVIDGGLTAI